MLNAAIASLLMLDNNCHVVFFTPFCWFDAGLAMTEYRPTWHVLFNRVQTRSKLGSNDYATTTTCNIKTVNMNKTG